MMNEEYLITNMEMVRDMTHIFRFDRVKPENEVKLGICQIDGGSENYLTITTPDFQVIFKGDGIMEIVPNKELYGDKVFDKYQLSYDTHSYYNFGIALKRIFGEKITFMYNYLLQDKIQVFPPSTN